MSESDLEELLNDEPSLNLGLLLGPRSGVIDLEYDSPKGKDDLEKLFDGVKLPATPTFQSPRGKHHLFHKDDRLEQLGKAVIHFGKLEIRLGAGGKAAQTLLPPSETSGFKRHWIRAPRAGKMARLPDVVIDRLLEGQKRKGKASHNGRATAADFAGLLQGVPKGSREPAAKRTGTGRAPRTRPAPVPYPSGNADQTSGQKILSETAATKQAHRRRHGMGPTRKV